MHLNILLLEDDPFLRLDLSKQLKLSGHIVTCCSTLQDAMLELNACSFDIIITDMVIKVEGDTVTEGGLLLINRIRRTSQEFVAIRNIPIIAISGILALKGMDKVLRTARMLGANTVMEKPIRIDALRNEIHRLTSTQPETVA